MLSGIFGPQGCGGPSVNRTGWGEARFGGAKRASIFSQFGKITFG